MTKKFKDFGSQNVSELADVSFNLYNQEFVCRKAIQGKVLLEVAKTAEAADAVSADETIEKFFSVALEPESFERFTQLIRDPETIVTVETLGEITGWLVEQYSGRPTQESSDS